jgi:hypothetical protein
VFTACAFCAGALGGDGGPSGLGVGRRFSFDPWKSRAWVICQRCNRWNLTPFDERIDTINALDRMAALWGTDRGPSTVVIRNATEREQRLVIMQQVLQHDAYRFVPAPAAPNPRPGRRMLYVELRRGDSRATVPFTLVAQRDGGWLVENVGLEAVMPSATPRRQTPP